jgi:phenylacetate-CoA ligase
MAEDRDFIRVPRSALADVRWPAIPASGPATLLALQFELEHSQWWSPEVLARQQMIQAAALLAHAAKSVPYYAHRLTAAGSDLAISPEALALLWPTIPILTRADVAGQGEILRSAALPPGHGTVQNARTSGTSGSPLTIAKSQLEQLMWQALTLREELWHERDWRGRIAVIRGFGEARYKSREGVALPDWGSPLADVYSTGPAFALDYSVAVKDQGEWLVRCAPDYLLTDAGNLKQLAAYFHTHGLALPKLRDVRAVGDVVDDDLRRLCRDAWGVKIADIYSCTEAGYLAFSCPEQGTLHVQAESVIVEVLDRAGKPCATGEEGDVVVTPLLNFAMPLIRYAVGDRAVVGAPCTCGRGLPTLKSIGRSPAVTAN